MDACSNYRKSHYNSSKIIILDPNNAIYPSSSDFRHTLQHQNQFFQKIEYIKQQYKNLKRDLGQNTIEKTLSAQIGQWKKESIA
jgi:hypothetical protein